MKVYQLPGYPHNHYFVKTFQEFMDMIGWMYKNNVNFLHESSGVFGYGFSVGKNIEWFLLRWT